MTKHIVIALSFLLSVTSYAESEEDVAIGSYGIGLGIPYGLLGLNADIWMAENLDATFGFGIGGPALGGRYYPFNGNNGPRLSLIYGPNSIIESTDCSGDYCKDDYEVFRGLNAAIGWGSRGGQSGFDLDLVMTLTDGGARERIKELEGKETTISESLGVRLSAGYHW